MPDEKKKKETTEKEIEDVIDTTIKSVITENTNMRLATPEEMDELAINAHISVENSKAEHNKHIKIMKNEAYIKLHEEYEKIREIQENFTSFDNGKSIIDLFYSVKIVPMIKTTEPCQDKKCKKLGEFMLLSEQKVFCKDHLEKNEFFQV